MTPQKIKRHLNRIAEVDSDVKTALAVLGYPAPRVRAQGLETLLAIIVGQQISTLAANAIMARVRALLPEMNARCLLELPQSALREAGLSARKVEYALGMASSIVDGDFQPEKLTEMEDEQVIAAICALRGFGVWSAQIYLMFSLQRVDIFPHDDLALQVALQRLKGLEHRPSPKQAQQLIQHWSPWRSAGSLFLWHYYRGAPA